MPTLKMVSATDPAAQTQLERLNKELGAYYNRPEIAEYYQRAHCGNLRWQPGSSHWLVRQLVRENMRVLDLGCGSGHAFENLSDLKPLYTGVDWSADQLRRNAERCAEAQFVSAPIYATGLTDSTFDLSFSFYVIEHLVWPDRFLREMVRVTKPGGTVIIECPLFRPFGRIPSLRFGRRILPLSQKLRRGMLFDASLHLFCRNLYYPIVMSRRFPRREFPFLINLEPSCLSGSYYPDNDAVYVVDRLEILEEFRRLGAVDITSEVVAGAHSVAANTCFVAVRKAL
jgi:ubiquinone/menaquinone biosynthesis C-methylase UbiE